MKTVQLTSILAIAAVLALGSSRSMADGTTETIGSNGPYAGDVINSTYTFSGLNPNGTDSFTATLDQTTIPDLNGISPAVMFQLAITSYTLTDTGDTFTGTGIPTITLSFQVMPNAQQGSGNFPTITVTLVGNQQINNSFTASASDPLVFTLQSAVPPTVSVAEQTPGNAGTQDNEGTGTFPEVVSNFEANGNVNLGNGFTVGTNQTTLNYSSQTQTYSVGGTLEVIYAVPEPNSGWLALLSGLGLGGLFLARRNARA
ncbi:MAG TPA: hypothetical protein VHY09_07105 [Candidatus Methylacidiphilales bacterium]|jgi:hypothetical protein|nr:hypothetical protein [Candidatus Methylacidiphilales bacterium]